MRALTYTQGETGAKFSDNYPTPTAGADEALVRVIRAGICSTDLEIIKGYVPGYNHVLGHEFVGRVQTCESRPDLVSKRVVGEINCNCSKFSCSDAIFQRNHAPGRVVLGIIGKDGALADWLTLPVLNLHVVPDNITDQQACFAEPLAAACRIREQGLVHTGDKVAVIGDGKLGLLVAQVLVAEGLEVTMIGRHASKMALVSGLKAALVSNDKIGSELEGKFDTVVEASGSAGGIRTAMAITRPMGTIVLKSTVSVSADRDAIPLWSELANDVVVNEKVLAGSRCGPFDRALELLQDPSVCSLVDRMITAVFPAEQAVEAVACAETKGNLKVQVAFEDQA